MKRILVALLVAAALIGCQSEADPTDNTTEPPITQPNITTPSDNETDVQQLDITLTEENIEPARMTAKPGKTRVTVMNTGRLYNELHVQGPGVNRSVKNGLFPDENKSFTITLKQGTYDVYSPIPGKRREGFDATLQVG